MRVAVGGIHTECSTYSPVLMQADDFRVLRAEELTSHPYFEFLRDYSSEVLPLFHARAVPGGPVSRAAYEDFKLEFLQRLEFAKPFDAVYLAMHGAMKVDGLWDAEGDWISAVRKVVGPEMLIAVSYDLHGNLSQRIIDQIDVFAAYRTAPHIDVEATMRAAFSMLLRALETNSRPFVTWVPVPLLLPGEKSSTEDEPARGLYAQLQALESPEVWRADLMVGYVWADEPRATACAVVTGIAFEATERAACKIAQCYWGARSGFSFGARTGTLADMLTVAKDCQTAPVILADSGDNPTGGGVGDRADVLATLIAQDWQGVLIAGITDAPAVKACFDAGLGAEVSLKIGGSLDPSGVSVRAQAKVLYLDARSAASEAQAVVQVGGITVILAARRRPYHDIADFTRLRLSPVTEKLLVVKSGYLSPELAPLANPNLMALTDGVVNQDIGQLSNFYRRQSSLPFDPNQEFTASAIHSGRAAV